jgi:DUF4097 and DUF4098 domain-containing protein YvlB
MISTRLRRVLPVLVLPLLVAAAGCDIVTAEFRSEETAEWRKTYPLDPKGQVEIENVNGKIDVQPSDSDVVEVLAIKKAKGPSPEAAKEALGRITIREESTSPSHIRITTKYPSMGGGLFGHGGLQVEYRVKVPVNAEVRFQTVNGGIDVSGLRGRVKAETTNGGVSGRDLGGALEASTTNGGLDIDLARVAEGGVRLECVNGGIKVRVPRDAKATISARITNGGINASDLPIETSGDNTKRRFEGRLNGGGPRIELEGTNGGIHVGAR